jgi:hypothetical protein
MTRSPAKAAIAKFAPPPPRMRTTGQVRTVAPDGQSLSLTFQFNFPKRTFVSWALGSYQEKADLGWLRQVATTKQRRH